MNDFLDNLNHLSSEDRQYALQNLATHLAAAGKWMRLQRLLTHYDFLQVKADVLGPQSLINDYEVTDEVELRLIQQALRLSAHALTQDCKQLAGQLQGRLLSHAEKPLVHILLEQLKPRYPWIRSLHPVLSQADSPLIRTLVGHEALIRSVVVTEDGQHVISASADGTVKIWELATGQELHTLVGHASAVLFAGVVARRQEAVSASDDGTIKLWGIAHGHVMRTL